MPLSFFQKLQVKCFLVLLLNFAGGCSVIAETYVNCTVAFAAIDGTSGLPPQGLVSLLGQIFSRFDEIFLE